jgi:glycosyltransferase involved in cell wall biosynthesis
MNCFNGETYLRKAIDSVYSQTYTNWEIVFWDNASTDNSVNIVKNYDNKIKYYIGNVTVPLYRARNSAIEKCNGQMVTFLDCDDIWIKNKLMSQVELYNAGNQFVYGRYELIDEYEEKINKKLHQLKCGKVTNSLLINNFISIGSVLIDTNLLKELKFNPHYNLIGDFDLWLRASMKTEFCFVDAIVEKSRQHKDNLSFHLKNDWITEERILYRDLLDTYGLLHLPMIFVFIIRSEVKYMLKKFLI